MKKTLVSIITPCFNGGKHLQMFLNSILNQTYSHIELIFVNDGSTDNTEDLVLSYQDKLNSKGIILKYIYQENKGLAGAINTGLKYVTGDFFSWPDSDDYLEPDSVEKKLNILINNLDYGVVTSDVSVRNIKDLNRVVYNISNRYKYNFKTDQFRLLLSGNSIFCSGAHMVRMDSFLKTHPSGQIYPAKRGQNWQILLPIYYKYKRYFLNKPLYNYIIYPSSMSRDSTKEKKIIRTTEYEDILFNTIKKIDMEPIEKAYYIRLIKILYAKRRLNIGYKHEDMISVKKEYYFLKKNFSLSLKDYLKYLYLRYKNFFKNY